MGGRGSKGKGRSRASAPVPEDPLLPPDATFRPEEPEPPTEQDADVSESRVREAYQELATKPQDWIRLAELREKLGNPDDAELKRILLPMLRTGLVHLAPDSSPGGRRRDAAAAIRIGDQDKHFLAIEPDYFAER